MIFLVFWLLPHGTLRCPWKRVSHGGPEAKRVNKLKNRIIGNRCITLEAQSTGQHSLQSCSHLNPKAAAHALNSLQVGIRQFCSARSITDGLTFARRAASSRVRFMAMRARPRRRMTRRRYSESVIPRGGDGGDATPKGEISRIIWIDRMLQQPFCKNHE